MPPRPLNHRRQIRLLIGITILSWATQTLVAQWGFGQTAPTERFISQDASATMELKSEALIVGDDVTLKHLARWSARDNDTFAGMENLVLMRLRSSDPYRTISLDEIKSSLREAGVNLGRIRFVGATVCALSRSDVQMNEGDALRQWVAATQSSQPPAKPAAADSQVADAPAQQSTETRIAPSPTEPIETPAFRSLKDVLIDDLAVAASVAPAELVLDFRPQDQSLLTLAEPMFQFHATLKRGRNLGSVAWEVIVTANGKSQKHDIIANARAWQHQVVVTQPLAGRQIIRDEDVIDRRTLVDHIDDKPPLKRDQVVGNMAALDLKPGTVMTARLVDAVPLVRSGQLVTVCLKQGRVQLKTVGRAMESGTFGQTIRVRNELTRDVFEVVMTGPQTASLGS